MITISIDTDDAVMTRLWAAVAELSAQLPPGWSLIGGLMVQLHALEHGETRVRPTRDIDILGEARPRGPLPAIDRALRADDFEASAPDLDGYGHRYERDGVVVDLLAPDGIKPPPDLGGGVIAVSVPGGSQALARSESVRVIVADSAFELRRPNILGAILIKARSILVHDDPAAQREDLLRLLSLVEDPRALGTQLKPSERRWVQKIEGLLDFDKPSLLEGSAQRQALLAYRILVRSPTATPKP